MISFNMLVPELDEFLTGLGGSKYLGAILGMFALSSLLVRPISGKMTDSIGRVPVIIFGSIVNVAMSVLYLFIYSIPQFLGLRFAHGISAGFQPTGLMAYLADVIPSEKRGEAMGLIGVFISAGIAIGQPLGSGIANAYGVDVLFYSGIAFAFIAFAMVLFLKETLKEPKQFKAKDLMIKSKDLFDRDVVFPFLIVLCMAFSYGDLLTIIPDYSTHMGIKNQGVFFSYFVFSSMFVRLVMGKVSDSLGRIKSLKIGGLITLIGMILFVFVDSKTSFFTIATILGIGAGVSSPTLIAYTVDLCKAENRGKAMSTYFIGLEGGIALGAFLTGAFYNNVAENIQIPIYLSLIASILAFVLLFITKPFGISQTD
ncbi:MAG: MFS transporter [Flavobacteriales bacterium]|nr:MFS transporter [Flavobacteriales bacterium]